jgi:iron-sulfur cluster repair protein YtfE (RIC family)
MDVFEMLKQDHRKVDGLFKQLEPTGDASTRQQLFTQLKQELDLHAQVEETILYPALKQSPKTQDITEEAYEEHAEVKQLLAQMQQTPPSDARFDELLAELRDGVEHHVEEEESEMFVKAREALSAQQIEEITRRVQEAKQQAPKSTGAGGA